MRTRTFISCLVVIFLGQPASLSAQHEAEALSEQHARHEVSLLLAHTHVAQGVDIDGDHTWLVLPSWGLNYNY